MSENRYAVLIASSKFPDEPMLQPLRCPENDVDGLNEILSSETYGWFTRPIVLKNRPHYEIQRTVFQTLKDADRNDLVLIYYSGHGKLDQTGRLHLATVDTVNHLLEATSVPIESIRNYVDDSSSTKVVLLLDCCFSGAVERAFLRSGVDDQLNRASLGRGIYIMTASTGIQTAQERETDRYGVFTKYVIEGIRSGEADKDGDGLVSMSELYKYVHDHVLGESFQEPMKWDLNVRGELFIARSEKTLQVQEEPEKAPWVERVEIVHKVTVGENPQRAVITPNGAEVYISNSGSNTVSIIETKFHTVTHTIPVGQQPSALAVSPKDGRRVYVGNNGGGVSVIDTATKQVRTIFTDGPVRDLAITPDGRKVYLAMERSGLRSIDTGTDAVEIVSHTGLPEGVAVTPDGRHVYVSYQGYGPIEKPGPVGTYGHDAIGVFAVPTNELIVTISSHLIPNVGGPIAISNDGQVWVNGLDACSAPYYDHKGCPIVPGGVINIFSAIKKEHLKTLPIPLDYGTGFISFLRDSAFALIGGSNLKIVDAKTFVLSKVVPIPVSGSIAFTQDSRHAYAPVPDQNQVMLLQIFVNR